MNTIATLLIGAAYGLTIAAVVYTVWQFKQNKKVAKKELYKLAEGIGEARLQLDILAEKKIGGGCENEKNLKQMD